MNLEDKLFNSFFYPFFVGICMSTLVVTIFLGIFTNNYYDRETEKNIMNLESKYSEMHLKSVNVLLSTILIKIQASLNEGILLYQRISKKVYNNKTYNFNSDNLKSAVESINETFLNNNKNELDHIGFWFINEKIITFDDIVDNNTKKQLITFSNLMHNLYSVYEAASTSDTMLNYYFYFEKTDLFITFPLEYQYKNKYLDIYFNYDDNPFWCTDDEGKVYKIYKMKCRKFYTEIQKAKTDAFDMNYLNNKNRTIYVTSFYKQLNKDDSYNVFTMCIQFLDPITDGTAFACSDIKQEDLIDTFDGLNSNLAGYYFISSVGFNNIFYYPQGTDEPRTITENIFRWESSYFLEEKTKFFSCVQKKLTSTYINNINSLYSEIYENGNNNSEQFFYMNNEKLKYSIFPVILNNLEGELEHILSIIYIYNNQLYFNKFNSQSSSNLAVKILLELIIFIVFGSGLLYIIYLTFNIVSKYIVIPTKNVNYMLKGINIGGQNRLDYIDFLRKKQEENLEKLEHMYLLEQKKNESKILNDEQDNNLLLKENENEKNENKTISEKNNDNNDSQDLNNTEFKGEILNLKEDYNKIYDNESIYIEREFNFYDFDESLLQYRPLEIENLVKMVIDLKQALILTSTDQNVEKLIEYSNSEEIFRNFKNKEGTTICQSNIGNLQTQLLKFDKAIYHLALSLQDNKLKRFLSRTLSDEYDESDTLMNKISYFFNKNKNKGKNNILMEKQQNNSKDHFSQKIIGVFINIRYCRLINAYYKFFKYMKKLEKNNNDSISGQFMNTHFHTIHFYHKTIIQYIYLSYVKNDLIKIGESILDYIEFLIKFKFKPTSETEHFLNFRYLGREEYIKKQDFKKKIFNKIINWFNLFDDYVSYVKDNTSLDDDKSIINYYTHSLNSENSELNSTNQSIFLFRVNIQRSEYIKGKFALCCKNYNDALFYFIRAAKKKSIVIDGLIKKKSLKHIYKIWNKMKKKYENYGMKNVYMNEKMKEFDKMRNKISLKKQSLSNLNKKDDMNINKNNLDFEQLTFGEEINLIKNDIINDISECSAKQVRDLMILIDFNCYLNLVNKEKHSDRIDAFISQTNVILNNYLSLKDRLGVLVYMDQYQIICPLMHKYEIDIKSFSKDLSYYKKINFLDENQSEEYDINSNHEFDFVEQNFSVPSNDNSSQESIKFLKKNETIENLVKVINYTNNYLKMKEGIKTEKYIIFFTDLFNAEIIKEEKVKKDLEKIDEDKNVIFILVGKNKSKCPDKNEDKQIMKLILDKFGEKSEMINFENMKKIKTILSSNNVIKDEIIYQNEIYK